MANLDFFAARHDQLEVLRFVFELELHVTEHSSDPGQDLRTFDSPEAVDSVYRLGVDNHGNGAAIRLILRSPSVEQLRSRRIEFKPSKTSGSLFRYEPEGWAMMQLYFGGMHDGVLTKSHFGHNSRARASAWNHENGVNWQALSNVSNKLQYHIRKRLAGAKAGPCPVLPEALSLALEGTQLKDSAKTPWTYALVAGV